MEVGEIKALIELFERSTLTELVLERGGAKLILKRQPPEGRSPEKAEIELGKAPEPEPQEPPASEAEEPSSGYIVRAPIVGTFYRRPSPDEDPYVEVGDRVDVGDVVCIVEAMKVMNEVRTERAGVVSEILVEDGAPVEYGQPLISIDTLQ